MTLLLGSVGWGLLCIGAITHVWHHARLRQLLAMHLDYERVPALALAGIEIIIAVGLPVALLTDWTSALVALAALATALSLGFVVWIARLLAMDSTLPCACSFSEAPTTRWSLGRSLCVVLVAFIAVVDPTAYETSTIVSTLAAGLALAAAIFVVPEALSWPTASRALLARVDAFDRGSIDGDAVAT